MSERSRAHPWFALPLTVHDAQLRTEADDRRSFLYVHKDCLTPYMHLQHAPPEAREAVDALRELLIANHDLQVASAESARREADAARRERDAALAQAASFLPDEAVRSDYLTEHGLGWLARLAPKYVQLVEVLRRAEWVYDEDRGNTCLDCGAEQHEAHFRTCEVAALLHILDANWAEAELEYAEAAAYLEQERRRGLQGVRNTPRGPSVISAGDFESVELNPVFSRGRSGRIMRRPFESTTAQYRAGLAVTSEELARIRELAPPLEGTREELSMARLYGIDLHVVDPKEPKK